MPPKKKATQPSQKTIQKKKEKIVEDKTFGLKNKKGKKQQDYVKHLSNQVKYGQQSAAKVEQQKFDEKKKKGDAQKEKNEIDKLFRPVSQKASAGADPKSVLCAFFKQGTCSKGDKCKFSHDLSLDRKTEKRSVYIDTRDDENLQEDTMDKWDQQKLEEVVNKKHGSEKAKPRTEIVCKYFLEAIEKNLYGWFWTCPNGGDKCMYRHALPPGFVLKKDLKKAEADDTVSLEELIETKRANLGANNLTKVTFETFMVWKKNRLEEKRKKLEAETKKKKAEMRAGRTVGISGREVFQFQPSLIKEGDDDDDAAVFERSKETAETNDIKYIDLTFEKLLAAASDDEPTDQKKQNDGNKSVKQNTADNADDDNKLGEAAGYVNVKADENADAAMGNIDVDIDEDLFMDEIDDELENLELAD